MTVVDHSDDRPAASTAGHGTNDAFFAQLSRLQKGAAVLNEIAAVLETEVGALQSAELAEVAEKWLRLDEAHDELNEARKRIHKVLERLDKGIFPERMKDSGQDMFRVPELGRSFSLQTKTSASMVDKEKGFVWLRENEAGDLIQETVPAQTLAAFLRDYVVTTGEDPPEDVFKLSTYNTISSRKYNPKKG